jgi:hypothetical protein
MKSRLYLIHVLAAIFLPCSILNAQNETHKSITNGVSMEKRTKFALLTFSLSDQRAENYQEFLTYYLDQSYTNWGISTDLGFLVDKNFGVGMGFSYGQTIEDYTSENSFGLITTTTGRSERFVLRPFIKNFVPLTPKNQIFIILQTELQYSTETSDVESMTLLDRNETTSKKNIYGIGFRPGILLFVIKNFALETNVNVLGISTSVLNASSTGQPDSRVVTTDIDFKIDLLQLNFGFSMYF